MDSYLSYDKTLPIDMNGSNNPDLLTEVTYGEIGVSPVLEKSGTGRMSPVRGRTMKEYDLQISELRKENFNLKCRIFFLEERLNTKFSGEDTIKTNIELKVEVETYKNDLQEKQKLLEKASETIDSMTAKYNEEVEKQMLKISKNFEDQLEHSNQRVEEMEEQLREKEEALADAEHRLDEHKNIAEALNKDIDDRDSEIGDLTGQLAACQQQLEALNHDAGRQKQQFMDEIERLTTSDLRKDRDIQRLSVIVQDRIEVEGLTALEKEHLQDAADDAKRIVEKLQQQLADKDRDLGRRGDMIGKLEDLLRKKEKDHETLEKAFEDKNGTYIKAKQQMIELIQKMHIMKKENEKLKDDRSHLMETIQRLEDEISRLRQELDRANLEKQQEANRNKELQDEIERLLRSLGRQEGELENFKGLLETAEKSLEESENVVASLERELAKEQKRSHGKKSGVPPVQDDVSSLQRQLDDLEAELEEQRRLYRAKCAELDSVARCLNIQVAAPGAGGSHDNSDMLHRILDEFRHLKDAVQSDRHLHINISSAFHDQDGNHTQTTHEGNGHASPRQHQDLSSTYPGHRHQNSSRIPIRKGSNPSCSKDNDTDDLHRQLVELEAKLRATEETTHRQTQKMKMYRNLLLENNLLPASLSKSDSVPNLDKIGHSSPRSSPSPQRSAEGHRSRSDSCPSSGYSSIIGKERSKSEQLATENSKLKEQLDRYKLALKAFPGRSLSPRSSLDNGKETEPLQPISMDNACQQLGACLDTLDRYLLEVSQGDQCGSSPTVSSTTDVSSLRRGLIQARGALNTLSETSLKDANIPDERQLSEGRLSSDSGCSDNNTASAPQTLRSSMVSPARSQSSNNSSSLSHNDKSSTSPLRQHFTSLDGQQYTSPSHQHNTSPRPNHYTSLDGQQYTSPSHQHNTSPRPNHFSSLDGQQYTSPSHKPNTSPRPNHFTSPDGHQYTSPSHQHNTSPRSLHYTSLDGQKHTSPSHQHNTSPYNLSGSHLSASMKQPCYATDSLTGSQTDHRTDQCFSIGSHPSYDHDFAKLPDRKPSNGSESGSSDYSHGLPQDNSAFSTQSKERLRFMSEKSNKGDFSVISMPSDRLSPDKTDDFDLRYNDSVLDKTDQDFFLKPMGIPLSSVKHLKQSKYTGRDSTYKKLLSQSLLDRTYRDSISPFDFNENSMLNMTQDWSLENRESKADMEKKIKSLENIIKSLQEQVDKKSRPDISSLHQQLLELQELRIQLERSMNNNKNLEKLLNDLAYTSELTIQELRQEVEKLREQLCQCQHSITEKVHIITEKEKIISETNVTLVKIRDNSAKDNADLDMYKERVKSLDVELKDKTSKGEHMAKLCQSLKTAVEQNKKRGEQLESDNKKHQESLHKYQMKTNDLKNELKLKSDQADQALAEVEKLQTRIAELEGDAELFKENEGNYKNMLEQNNNQIAKLVSELEKMKDENKHLESLTDELERSRDTVEEQDRQLIDKRLRIEQLTQERNQRDETLQKHAEERQSIKNELERVNSMNSKLSTQLEQQRMNCANYKRQVDKQNHMMKDMKDKMDRVNNELTQDKESRDSLETEFMSLQKQLSEASTLRDQYLLNCKVLHKEVIKCKRELKDAEKKYQNTSALNNSLTVQLNIREKLMEEKGAPLTDDAKQNIISQLLNELKCARIQMTEILEQNDRIKQKIGQLIQENEAAKRSGSNRPSAEGQVKNKNMDESLESQNSSISSPANTTWPLSEDRTDSGRGGYSSRHSLPAREVTLGGCAGYNKGENSAGSSSSQGFSVPGPVYKQGISDHCILYNVNDSPKYVAGLTQYRVDSDLRSVFVIGKVDHYEKLQKETNECCGHLKGLTTRINERLKTYAAAPASESKEYSTLKELSYSAEHLRICVDVQKSMLDCFWTSELPAPNEKGEFVNTKLISENSDLKEKFSVLLEEYRMLAKSSVRQEQASSEEHVCRSLQSTLEVVTRAKSNFQHKLSSPKK